MYQERLKLHTWRMPQCTEWLCDTAFDLTMVGSCQYKRDLIEFTYETVLRQFKMGLLTEGLLISPFSWLKGQFNIKTF